MAAGVSLSIRARLARSVFWLAWSRGVIQLISFGTTILLARLLQPADYGVMAVAGIWTTTAGMLAEMGLGAAIIQFRDIEREEIDTCFWITISLATFSYAVLAISTPVIAEWFATPRLSEVLPVLGLVLPITACGVVPTACCGSGSPWIACPKRRLSADW